MYRLSVFIAAVLLSGVARAQTNAPSAATNTPAGPKTITLQEMLVIGHPSLKLHSLAMVTQGKAPGGVDESYLPGFKVCSEDRNIPVRSIAARLLGEHFIQGKEPPNPEALTLLIKLAGDEADYVRYNAVYHGLTQVQDKSPELVKILIEVAATDREERLYERIGQSLESYREQAATILDEKLKENDSITFYEIYADLTGKKPTGAERYLDMPSSRPVVFIISVDGKDAEAFKAKLEEKLVSIGLENPDVSTSGSGGDSVLMIRTFLTKDRIAVENAFAEQEKFSITQVIWLTPELEVQFDTWRNK